MDAVRDGRTVVAASGAALWSGVALLAAANVLMPLQDAMAKDFVRDLPVWQVLLVRSVAVLTLALLIGRGALLGAIACAKRVPIAVLRSLLNLAAWSAFYLALRDLPLAQAITLYFFSPILVALLAGPLLGERASRVQWIGVALGFGGVVLASGAADFDLSTASALGLLAAALWALTMIMMRAVAIEQSALTQVAITNAVFVVVTGAVALWAGWQADLTATLWITIAGIAGGSGQYALYAAARRISITTLGALEYGSLFSGFLFGWLFFAEVPALSVWFGAALVIASGLLVLAGERGRERRAIDLVTPLAPALPIGPGPLPPQRDGERK